VDRTAELIKSDLALHMPLKDTHRFLVHFKTFQP
jgi:hypothetical protein